MPADSYPVPLFRLPFRPLFLFASLFAVLGVGVWGISWFFPIAFNPFGGLYWWHAHEMIFGFVGAVLVGFLLTAARTWTGLPGTAGLPLILLVCLWLAARIVMVLGDSAWLMAVQFFSVSFWLLALYFFARMILKARMWRNMFLILVLMLMAALDLTTLTRMASGGNVLTSLHGAIALIMLVLTIIGGRVLPFFTSSVTGSQMVVPRPWLEYPIIFLTVGLFVWTVSFGLIPPSPSLGLALSALGLLHLGRFMRWDLTAMLSRPMLWSLLLAYLFLILGVGLLAGYHLGLIPNVSGALHAITIGSVGGMILSMISRVSLGHTGREIIAGKWLAAAFVLVALAALIRTFTPMIADARYWSASYHLSACLWCIAYTIWLVKFLPLLIASRPDGKPG